MGINNKIQLSNAEIFAQNKFREKLAQTGITLLSPETIFLSYDTIIQKDSIIHPNVVIGPKVKVEKNCEILPFSFCLTESIFHFAELPKFRKQDRCRYLHLHVHVCC